MSADAKHSPGPWEVYTDGASLRIRDARGVVIAEVDGDAWGPEAVADAYVLAAAPALLEALRDMVSDRTCLSPATIGFAQRALASAEPPR